MIILSKSLFPLLVYLVLTLANNVAFEVDNYSTVKGNCFPITTDDFTFIQSFSANFSECTTLCNERTECKSLLWQRFGEPNCHLLKIGCGGDIGYRNDTYSLVKKTTTDHIVMLGSTYFLKWFGNCMSESEIMYSSTANSTAECANECEKRRRCEAFVFTSYRGRTVHNCFIREEFCFDATQRINRGNHNWQLFKRVSFDLIDVYGAYVLMAVTLQKFYGICPHVSSTAATGDTNCAKICSNNPACKAFAYYTNENANCVFMTKMCDPKELVKSESVGRGLVGWQTYKITNDIRDFPRVSLGSNLFMNISSNRIDGTVIVNTSAKNEVDCAYNCLKMIDCKSFTYSHISRSSCRIYNSWTVNHSIEIGSNAFIRLSSPANVDGHNMTKYSFECGRTYDHVVLEPNISSCAERCKNTADCVAYLYTYKPHRGARFTADYNCGIKAEICSLESQPKNATRLLLDDWSLYVDPTYTQIKTNYLIFNGSHDKQILLIDQQLQQSACVAVCDDQPSCKGFVNSDGSCLLIYCRLLEDSSCFNQWSQKTPTLYVKNGTGADIVTWSERQFTHWHAKCDGDDIHSSSVGSWQQCINQCVLHSNCFTFQYTSSSQRPNCFLKSRLCPLSERQNVGNLRWNLYNQSSYGPQTIGNTMFLPYNGYCESAETKFIPTDNLDICANECLKADCKVFATTPKNDLGYTCELKPNICPPEEQLHVGSFSHFMYERIQHKIPGLLLDKIFIFDPTSVKSYNLTEEQCYSNCTNDHSCLGFSYNNRGTIMQAKCFRDVKLNNFIPEFKSGWNSWKYDDSLIKVGYVKLDGHCSPPQIAYSADPTFCARKCAANSLCSSFTVINNTRCSLSNSYCTSNGNYSDVSSINKVVYKTSVEVQFVGVPFVKVAHMCASVATRTYEVQSVADCARLCVAHKCSQFLWSDNNETLRNCYVQEDFCPPTSHNQMESNETRVVYQRLNRPNETYMSTSEDKIHNDNVNIDNYTLPVQSVDQFSKHKAEYGVAIVVSIIVLAIFAVAILCFIRRNRKLKELKHLELDLHDTSKEIDPMMPIFDQLDNLKVDKQFELPLERISVDNRNLKVLGRGQFGLVVLGSYTLADQTVMQVAVKRTRNVWDSDQYRMLFKEICLMANIGKHPNLVNMIGFVTQISRGHLYLVMDYCGNGSLRSFITKKAEGNSFVNELVQDSQMGEVYKSQLDRSCSVSSSKLIDDLSTSHLLSFAYQIASGMEYVASVNFIHRDLAARNILLTSNLIAKVADFGLGQQDYQFYEKDKTVMLPIRWLAPEAILRHKFSIHTDVWSFGLTVGEIFSLGCVPFANVGRIDQNFAKSLVSGEIKPEKPQFAPAKVYQLIEKCCHPDPKLRCSFTECKSQLEEEFRLCNNGYFVTLVSQLAEQRQMIEAAANKLESAVTPEKVPKRKFTFNRLSKLKSKKSVFAHAEVLDKQQPNDLVSPTINTPRYVQVGDISSHADTTNNY